MLLPTELPPLQTLPPARVRGPIDPKEPAPDREVFVDEVLPDWVLAQATGILHPGQLQCSLQDCQQRVEGEQVCVALSIADACLWAPEGATRTTHAGQTVCCIVSGQYARSIEPIDIDSGRRSWLEAICSIDCGITCCNRDIESTVITASDVSKPSRPHRAHHLPISSTLGPAGKRTWTLTAAH